MVETLWGGSYMIIYNLERFTKTDALYSLYAGACNNMFRESLQPLCHGGLMNIVSHEIAGMRGTFWSQSFYSLFQQPPSFVHLC